MSLCSICLYHDVIYTSMDLTRQPQQTNGKGFFFQISESFLELVTLF